MNHFYKDKVAVVTGASSGIGRAVAAALAQNGSNVVLAARHEGPLQELAVELGADRTLVAPTDVTVPEQTKQLAEQALTFYDRIDLLFNCAGIMHNSGFGALDPEIFRQHIETNLMGTVNCLRAVIPLMQKQQGGHIVNISSLLGRYPLGGTSAYCTSKYAIAGLSGTLRHELKHDHIYLTTVFPSFVKTTMLNGHMKSVRESRFYKMTSNYPPEKVAAAILKGVAKRKRELTLPRHMHFTVLLHALFPNLVENITGHLLGGWPRYDQPWEP